MSGVGKEGVWLVSLRSEAWVVRCDVVWCGWVWQGGVVWQAQGVLYCGVAVVADTRNVSLSHQNYKSKGSASEGWQVWRLVKLYCLLRVINVRVVLNIHWNKSTNASYVKSVPAAL